MPILTSGVRRSELSLRADGAIAFALFLVAAIWGFAYWKHFTALGQPFYYQLYFEPSVMVACGKGFVVARPQVPEMVSFLLQRQDRFSCDAIPAGAALTRDEVFQQGPWLYLMLVVGWTWRIVGVAWSALGPLFAAMFAMCIVAGYFIFRLGVGRLLALAGAGALATSRLHLHLLPELRDYAKAPMMLVLLALLGLLVLGRTSWKRTVGIAAAYGAVLGIGYGFRSDFVAYFPPLFISLLFVRGGIVRQLPIKATAAIVCVGAFFLTAWPVLSTLAASKPGCQWHVVLLGFAPQFDRPLGVAPAPYEVARGYSDEWEYTTTTSYAARVHPGTGHIEYCEAPYGDATRGYLFEIVRRFPADLVVRAYASVLRIVELPFLPIEGRDDLTGHELNWNRSHHVGLALFAAATLLVAISDLRLGLFVVALTLYFGGLPAVQFSERHFFHFEFLTWFAILGLIQFAVDRARGAVDSGSWSRAAPRAAFAMASCVFILLVVLWGMRAYQQPRVAAWLSAFVLAPRDRIAVAGAEVPALVLRTAPHTDPETAEFVIVELDRAKCGGEATVEFRYAAPRRSYSRTFTLRSEARTPGRTQIFSPVYDGFDRLTFGNAAAGCVDGVYRVREPGRFSMLPEVVLPPDWDQRPLYQRLAD